ncbi:hypothetical protein FDECE_9304 [Fusarium decemcellulare]|nr:hypothetical protein FDECE_9304 [Fusarium decemcellulare]
MPNQRGLRSTQRRLMAKYGIEFLGPIDSLRGKDEPFDHDTITAHVRQLGRTQFSQYYDNVTIDSNERPWRGQMRRRAERITSLARMCLKGRKNEMGWRLTLESEVMARFTVEVSCRRCRGRLWRSEQEVAPASTTLAQNSSAPLGARDLKKRQQMRQACVCHSLRHREDLTEQGISLLFDDRADEAIVYNEELKSQLPKREERPDRVYGLCRTRRLDRILCMNDKQSGSEGKSIEETLPTTPFRVDGDGIIFPFLILEAKSEKGSDSFTDIEVQTAFAIREVLSLQHGLYRAAIDRKDNSSGPLVWFLSNKGEQWRVAIGYVDSEGASPRYLVTRLWSGAVDSINASLQLLLIIDYICDWARDIHRESVINCLRSLVTADSRSLAYDSDVFSLAAGLDRWNHFFDGDQESASDRSRSEDTQDPLQAFDTQTIAARDARYVHYRVAALYITGENMVRAVHSSDAIPMWAEKFLSLLKGAWLVKKECLDSLEAIWTGTDRDGTDMSPPDKMFLAVFTISAYISPDWQQNMEIGYIAIAEDAFQVLAQMRGMNNPALQQEFPEVCGEAIQATFKRGECFSTTFKLKPRGTKPGVRTIQSFEQDDLRVDAFLAPDMEAETANFISAMYRRYQNRGLERLSSVLRISSQVKKQGSLDQVPPSREELWAKRTQLIQPEDSKVWFVTTQIDQSISCIYVLDPSLAASSLVASIKRSARTASRTGMRSTIRFQSKHCTLSRRNAAIKLRMPKESLLLELDSYLEKLKTFSPQRLEAENDATPSPEQITRLPTQPDITATQHPESRTQGASEMMNLSSTTHVVPVFKYSAPSGTREDPIIIDIPPLPTEHPGLAREVNPSQTPETLARSVSECNTAASLGSQDGESGISSIGKQQWLNEYRYQYDCEIVEGKHYVSKSKFHVI